MKTKNVFEINYGDTLDLDECKILELDGKVAIVNPQYKETTIALGNNRKKIARKLIKIKKERLDALYQQEYNKYIDNTIDKLYDKDLTKIRNNDQLRKELLDISQTTGSAYAKDIANLLGVNYDILFKGYTIKYKDCESASCYICGELLFPTMHVCPRCGQHFYIENPENAVEYIRSLYIPEIKINKYVDRVWDGEFGFEVLKQIEELKNQKLPYCTIIKRKNDQVDIEKFKISVAPYTKHGIEGRTAMYDAFTSRMIMTQEYGEPGSSHFNAVTKALDLNKEYISELYELKKTALKYMYKHHKDKLVFNGKQEHDYEIIQDALDAYVTEYIIPTRLVCVGYPEIWNTLDKYPTYLEIPKQEQ